MTTPLISTYPSEDAISLQINASGEKVGFVFTVPKSGTIDTLSFHVAAAASSQTLKVGLYTVDASGDPTATAYGGMVAGTQASPAANTWYDVNLSTSATATKGDTVAMVIEFDSTAGDVIIMGIQATVMRLPYSKLYTTSWATSSAVPNFGLIYSDTTRPLIAGVLPCSNIVQQFYNSGSSPYKTGLKFRLPFACTVSGVWMYQRSGTETFSIKLIDSDGSTVLTTISTDNAYNGGNGFRVFEFPANQSLSVNTYYRIIVEATSVTNDYMGYYFDVNASAWMAATPGGADFHYTADDGVGGWTDTTTRQPFIGPIITSINGNTIVPIAYHLIQMQNA